MNRRPTEPNVPPSGPSRAWHRASFVAAAGLSTLLFAATAVGEPSAPVDREPSAGSADYAPAVESDMPIGIDPLDAAPPEAPEANDEPASTPPAAEATEATPDADPRSPSVEAPEPTVPSASVGAEGDVARTSQPPAPAAPKAPAPAAPAPAAPAPAGEVKRGSVRPVTRTNVVPVIHRGVDTDGNITLMASKSVVVATALPYKTISITNPEVADFNRINDNEVLLTAKKAGQTQLMIWNTAGESQVVDVNVGTDLQSLREQLARIFPDAKIAASNANGTIVLKGRVPSTGVADQAVLVAKPYAQNVLNLMEVAGGRQVMLQVRFAEVSRAASSELGFNTFGTDGTARFGSINGPGGAPIGSLATGAAETTISTGVTLFGAGQVGNVAFEYFVQALRRNNLLRILAEPTLIAMSGERASFLAGGEFPIPVPQDSGDGSGTITVEYKQFGVRLNFLPTVVGDGNIRLEVEPEVSDLDFSRSVSLNGFVIPSLTKRTLKTTVELRDGQTFAVGGLLNTRVTANKDVTPLLGDIPVLGALFRSTRYERNETELVVLVTPRVVEPLNPGQVPTLPGQYWRHPSESELFLDRDLGGPRVRDGTVPADAREQSTTNPGPAAGGPPARFRGRYGFLPAE